MLKFTYLKDDHWIFVKANGFAEALLKYQEMVSKSSGISFAWEHERDELSMGRLREYDLPDVEEFLQNVCLNVRCPECGADEFVGPNHFLNCACGHRECLEYLEEHAI